MLARLDLDGLAAEGVELERVELTDASLRGATLRASRLWRCRAHGALLDGADLRSTSWSEVSFHVGSTRSGLLLGAPPLEGSRTGFYAEAAADERFAPDDARAASLRGCDLRGARFVDTSLFRVDLRGARLDPPLREQARRDGALLD